jgi:hypothetical protein
VFDVKVDQVIEDLDVAHLDARTFEQMRADLINVLVHADGDAFSSHRRLS